MRAPASQCQRAYWPPPSICQIPGLPTFCSCHLAIALICQISDLPKLCSCHLATVLICQTQGPPTPFLSCWPPPSICQPQGPPTPFFPIGLCPLFCQTQGLPVPSTRLQASAIWQLLLICQIQGLPEPCPCLLHLFALCRRFPSRPWLMYPALRLFMLPCSAEQHVMAHSWLSVLLLLEAPTYYCGMCKRRLC